MEQGVEVAERSAAGPFGLDELYERHVPSARALAFVLTGSPEAAEDLVHDAFIRVAGRFQHLRRPEAVSAYLRRTVVTLHLSRLRRLRLERRYLAEQGPRWEPASAMPDVAGREDLWTALQGLPPRQRAALVLRFYEDLSERETADLLRCSVAAVKSLVSRGLRALRAGLEREER